MVSQNVNNNFSSHAIGDVVVVAVSVHQFFKMHSISDIYHIFNNFLCAHTLFSPFRFNDTNMINIKAVDKSIGRSVTSNNKASFPFPLKNAIFSTFNEPPRNHQPKIIYASSPVSRTYKTQNSLYLLLPSCSFPRF